MRGLVPNRIWEVYVYGEVPECLEVIAPTREAAISRAMADILDRLELKAEPQNPDADPKPGCTPVGEQKAKSRPDLAPTPAGEGKAKP